MQLRQELIAASVQLPLPRFSWMDSVAKVETTNNHQQIHHAIPPPPVTDRRNSLQRRTEWPEANTVGSRRNSSSTHQHKTDISAVNSDVPSTDSEVEQCESSCGGEDGGSGSSIHKKVYMILVQRTPSVALTIRHSNSTRSIRCTIVFVSVVFLSKKYYIQAKIGKMQQKLLLYFAQK